MNTVPFHVRRKKIDFYSAQYKGSIPKIDYDVKDDIWTAVMVSDEHEFKIYLEGNPYSSSLFLLIKDGEQPVYYPGILCEVVDAIK